MVRLWPSCCRGGGDPRVGAGDALEVEHEVQQHGQQRQARQGNTDAPLVPRLVGHHQPHAQPSHLEVKRRLAAQPHGRLLQAQPLYGATLFSCFLCCRGCRGCCRPAVAATAAAIL